jgi:hypothetical protein
MEVVRTRGLTYYDRLYVYLALGMTPVAVLVFVFATGRPTTSTLPLRMGIALGIIVVGYLWQSNIQGIRAVEIGSEGVAFRYSLHRERVTWSELAPSSDPFGGGKRRDGWFIARHPAKGGGRDRAYFVTKDQARAILTSPFCPKWSIPDSTRLYLGIPAS